MITLEYNQFKGIELFGRNQLKERYSKFISFKPYFYVDDINGTFQTIDGNKVRKIVSINQKDIINQRRELDEKKIKHYEADISITNRYIIDNVKVIEKEPIRICYIDIETDTHNGFSDPFEAVNPITIIGLYDSFTEKKTLLELRNYPDEVGLLYAFVNYIQTIDPDILVAWYGDGFDFPYIMTRMVNKNIDLKELSRNNGYSYVRQKQVKSCKIYGRILFDLLAAYKKHFSSGGRESWSLDYISKYELGELGGKEEYNGTLDDLYKLDYEKYLKYNIRDVELLILLDNKLKIIEFFDEIRIMGFCQFEDVFMNSKVADCLCLKYAKEHNIVLPSINYGVGDKYEGGYVVECNPKLYENIVVMDFKSLYPSIMIGFNTSYETLTDKGEINVDNKYQFKKARGIIPSIVKPLLVYRDEIKKVMKEIDGRTQDYKMLNLKQKAVKIIANSFYGVIGFKNFRLYNREVASAITYIARKIIKEAVKWFEDRKYNVIYGDTDSIFIEFKNIEVDYIKEVNVEINNYFKTFIGSFGVEREHNIFDLEFEEIFSVLFFKQKDDGTGAKKKYAGKLIWKNGHQTKEIAIVGFESKRSDSPKIGRIFMDKVLNMVLDKEPPEKIFKLVEEFKLKIRNGEFKAEELGLPVGINKPLDQYGNVMHIRASRLANEKHNEGIKVGDKVKYVFIKGENNVIAFKEKMPKGYEIDYENMIRRIIDLKIEPIFKSLNWIYGNRNIIKSLQKTL